MNLKIKVSFLKKIGADKLLESMARFRSDDQTVDIQADMLTEDQLDRLLALAKGKDEGSRGLAMRINSYRNIRCSPAGKPINRLEDLATALRAYIEPSPNHWVIYDETDGNALPLYVSNIQYNPPRRDVAPHVDMDLCAVTRGKRDDKNVHFNKNDLGKTVVEILNEKGYYLETQAAVDTYWETIELYKRWATGTGAQYHAFGTGYITGQWGYGYQETSMEREGQPSTVVMDDGDEEGDDRRSHRGSEPVVSTKFWERGAEKQKSMSEDGEESEGGVIAVPVHPYVKIFDLQRHEFMKLHVSNLKPYEFDATAAGKLVLPETTKDLVVLLVKGSSEVMEDIVRGKTGGTIVISTGPPGTGKTLTAEVFAEEIQRPLYVVQCSQLGTDEEKVEKQLSMVLTRASRWKAILLIDEADVYVHERGTDIQQNAIVGVFLRVLEHYRGVLFLTSNRATVIDDAIMSRATAWIRYELPTPHELGKIWKVLSAQYDMKLDASLIDALVAKFPHISGRNVKNLIKLARMLLRAKQSKKADLMLFEYVSKYLDLRRDEERGKN
jgi:hypothetical protein